MKIHTKRRKANNNEPWIGELLDEASEDKLLEMSAIPTDIPLPLPNQEKLARAVIDKADVFDEEERERRKQYEKAYCRKQFLRTGLVVGVIVCVFIALYLGGVFNNVLLDHYEYGLEAMIVQNCEAMGLESEIDLNKLIKAGFFGDAGVIGKQTEALADQDKLENTAYKVAERYCSDMAYNYAIDECKPVRLFEYKDASDPAVKKAGGSILVSEMVVTFTQIDRTGELVTQENEVLKPLPYGETSEWMASNYMTRDLEQVIPSDQLTKKQASAIFLVTLDK